LGQPVRQASALVRKGGLIKKGKKGKDQKIVKYLDVSVCIRIRHQKKLILLPALDTPKHCRPKARMDEFATSFL